MSVILLYKLFVGFALSSFIGILILAHPALHQKRQTLQEWGRSTTICLLLSGLMYLAAYHASMASDAAKESMTTGYQMFFYSMSFIAAAFGFGISALFGGTAIVLMLASQSLAKVNRPHHSSPARETNRTGP